MFVWTGLVSWLFVKFGSVNYTASFEGNWSVAPIGVRFGPWLSPCVKYDVLCPVIGDRIGTGDDLLCLPLVIFDGY